MNRYTVSEFTDEDEAVQRRPLLQIKSILESLLPGRGTPGQVRARTENTRTQNWLGQTRQTQDPVV